MMRNVDKALQVMVLREKKVENKCCFCGKKLVQLSFEILSCGDCHVMYDQHDMRIYMVGLPRSFSARWREVPKGVMVVLKSEVE